MHDRGLPWETACCITTSATVGLSFEGCRFPTTRTSCSSFARNASIEVGKYVLKAELLTVTTRFVRMAKNAKSHMSTVGGEYTSMASAALCLGHVEIDLPDGAVAICRVP